MKAGWITAAWRLLWCALTASAYQIATNPFVIAGMLALTGHWNLAALLVVTWFAVHAVAVTLSFERKSRLPGREAVTIFTTPDFLFALGNEQDGNAPTWYRALHPTWSRRRCAFVFSAWRNKLRNLPFVKALAWLHKPTGELEVYEWKLGRVRFRLRMRDWMTEFEYFTASRFGDFGPRLDQPDEWGAVSWAFRPWGRL